MTTIQQCPHQHLPTQCPHTAAGGGGDIGQVSQKGGPVLATAGSPVQQAPSGKSWLSKNIKLVGILGGAVAGGAIGFLTLGPVGGLGGAAVGALAGYLLTKNRGASGGGALLPPPLPDIR